MIDIIFYLVIFVIILTMAVHTYKTNISVNVHLTKMLEMLAEIETDIYYLDQRVIAMELKRAKEEEA